LRYHRDTNGLFDPAVLPALERAGYDRSIELVQAGTVSARRTGNLNPQTRSAFGQVEVADDRLAVRLPAGMRIDLGGIAKGWIAEQAAHLLNRYAPACAVNAGGDQYSCGRPSDEPFWQVGLENPFDPKQDLAVLALGPGAVATSSVIKRRWKQGHTERHHLIDPRSGLPAETPWASVTVITDTAVKAEVLAKALLIAGNEGAGDLMTHYPKTAFIAVDMQANLWGSENSKELFYGHYSKVF
jgi:thiamine biosynthesis lipoprotein